MRHETLERGAVPAALVRGTLDKNPRDASALFFLALGYAEKKMYREAVDTSPGVSRITADSRKGLPWSARRDATP